MVHKATRDLLKAAVLMISQAARAEAIMAQTHKAGTRAVCRAAATDKAAVTADTTRDLLDILL